MEGQHALFIKMNDRCTLDAGYWQSGIDEDHIPYRFISSPQTTLYQQLLTYLEEATKDQKAPPKNQLHFGEVALATVAVCIRWGSYLAVLMRQEQPQWPPASHPNISCISDGEMARINIEASAALAQWIDLMRSSNQHFRKMVKAAIQLLPFPITHLDASLHYNRFRALSSFNSANGRQYLMQAFERDFGTAWVEQEKERILLHPTRALANGILNEHWRNGSSIEDIHAGVYSPPTLPLAQCRLTAEQETLLMRETSELFVPTIRALYNMVVKPSNETWPEQALPLAIAFKPPIHWSLSEQTRDITLPDAEP